MRTMDIIAWTYEEYMRTMDIIAWTYEGGIYCNQCAKVDNDDPEWSPVFGEYYNEEISGYCCGACNHNLACIVLDHGDMAYACPGCNIASLKPL